MTALPHRCPPSRLTCPFVEIGTCELPPTHDGLQLFGQPSRMPSFESGVSSSPIDEAGEVRRVSADVRVDMSQPSKAAGKAASIDFASRSIGIVRVAGARQ